MKRLLLALVVSGIAIITTFTTPGQASADCVTYHYYYYTAPGGTYCGLTYVFCSGEVYQQGCQTPYYNEYYNSRCYCP
jgi:hypothetical protein